MSDQNTSAYPAATGQAQTDNEAIGGALNESNISTPAYMLQLTRFTSRVPNRLAKSYNLEAGELKKTSAGQMVAGEYEVLTIQTAGELAGVVMGLEHNQALGYGLPQCSNARGTIASRKKAAPGELTRTRENFDWWKGPAILFVDYDPPPGAVPLTALAFWEFVIAVCPALATAPAVIISSASGFICNANTGEELKGAGGWHAYIIVADGRDIPRAGQAIYAMSWLAGHGRFDISSAGTLLERSLVDAAVLQPERLDFAAGAACTKPLEQRRPEPLIINPTAAPFDTRQLQIVTASGELENLKARARAAVAVEAKQARTAWVEARVAAGMAAHTETDPDKRAEKNKRLRTTYNRATEDGLLLGDFPLLTEDGRRVTVGEILDNPGEWHGKRFADPLEPEYRDDHRIAWANLQSGGKPSLYSHAHGGRRYVLVRAPQTVQVMGGEMPRIVEAVQQHAHRAGELYQRGGELVRVADGLTLGVHPAWLKTHLETVTRFENFKRDKTIQVDCPGDLPQRIMANRGGWPFDEIVGVINAPTMRPDGSILDRPGYDRNTKLLLLDDDSNKWPTIPAEPTAKQARAALLRLWEPFAHFPFVKPVDRAVALAAMLTATVRRTLPTSPGFGPSAYQMGTGKTKVAQCFGILTNGRVPAVAPWPDNTEEQRKTLMAALLAGQGAILLDNIERPLSSSELCAALTGETYEDRRLGHSERVKASTRVLLMATGNNLSITGDLSRRILPVTLDHGVERPEILHFPFDPVARVAERWLTLRADALTILRAFVVAGQPAKGKGKMGSFEIWDGLVRQCVVWLRDNELAPFELADPADAVSDTINADPVTQKLRNLLCCWWERFKNKPMKVGDLIKAGGQPYGSMATLDDLGDILHEIAGEGHSINPRRLGRWVERHAGRQLEGKKIVEAGRSGGSCRWRVVECRDKQ